MNKPDELGAYTHADTRRRLDELEQRLTPGPELDSIIDRAEQLRAQPTIDPTLLLGLLLELVRWIRGGK